MALLVDRESSFWPARVDDLRRPPRQLWVWGSLPPEGAVAVVGTRTPSRGGMRAARAVTTELVEAGIPVLSGLAPGIDREVHEAVLDTGAPTWAVVGGAVDRLEPGAESLGLRMVAAGGGVLSEQPPGTPVTYQRRMDRNRIQAALAQVVVVAEASLPDGTMYTVEAAVALGRPVQVLDPDRWELGDARGSRALLRSSAELEQTEALAR